jgi:hypothetical protein
MEIKLKRIKGQRRVSKSGRPYLNYYKPKKQSLLKRLKAFTSYRLLGKKPGKEK